LAAVVHPVAARLMHRRTAARDKDEKGEAIFAAAVIDGLFGLAGMRPAQAGGALPSSNKMLTLTKC
jgi:hypothetical protein